jgi:hypothetical protein
LVLRGARLDAGGQFVAPLTKGGTGVRDELEEFVDTVVDHRPVVLARLELPGRRADAKNDLGEAALLIAEAGDAKGIAFGFARA